MKALVLASDKAELKGLGDRYETRVIGIGLVMAAINATRAIIECNPDIVVNIGSCGGGDDVEIGDVVMCDRVITMDQDLSLYRLPPGSTIDERRTTVGEVNLFSTERHLLLSSSRFASTLSSLHPDVYDMEGYAVALASQKLGRKCAIFKLVTDKVGVEVNLGEYSKNLRTMKEELHRRLEEFLSSLA